MKTMDEIVGMERFSLNFGQKADFQRKGDFVIPMVISGEGLVCSQLMSVENLEFDELLELIGFIGFSRKIGCDNLSYTGSEAPRLSRLEGDEFSLLGLSEDEPFVVIISHLIYSRNLPDWHLQNEARMKLRNKITIDRLKANSPFVGKALRSSLEREGKWLK